MFLLPSYRTLRRFVGQTDCATYSLLEVAHFVFTYHIPATIHHKTATSRSFLIVEYSVKTSSNLFFEFAKRLRD